MEQQEDSNNVGYPDFPLPATTGSNSPSGSLDSNASLFNDDAAASSTREEDDASKMDIDEDSAQPVDEQASMEEITTKSEDEQMELDRSSKAIDEEKQENEVEHNSDNSDNGGESENQEDTEERLQNNEEPEIASDENTEQKNDDNDAQEQKEVLDKHLSSDSQDSQLESQLMEEEAVSQDNALEIISKDDKLGTTTPDSTTKTTFEDDTLEIENNTLNTTSEQHTTNNPPQDNTPQDTNPNDDKTKTPDSGSNGNDVDMSDSKSLQPDDNNETAQNDDDEDDEKSITIEKEPLAVPQHDEENSQQDREEEPAQPQEQDDQEDGEPVDNIIPQAHEIIIPNYASWFNLKKIHGIEKKSLPEFFTNRIPSKTPEIYVKYRNFMVNSYRLNPNEYFSVTTARRNISGDAAAIFRVHKFLMKWGLINYQVNSKILPKNIEPPLTSEFSTRHDAPRGIFPFESYKPSVQLPDMAKLKKMMDTDDPKSTLSKYLIDMDRKKRTVEQFEEKQNNTVEANKGDSAINEDSKELDLNRSVKRPKILTESKGDWEREDLKKLLKGIKTYGSDWYKIAKEVGNKTPEQCILKFLQLPIEDSFLYHKFDDENHKPNKISINDLGPLKYAPHLPFSKSENPVLSTIAFLIGLVDPKIVQKMTDRALRDFSEEPKESSKEDSNGYAEEDKDEKANDEKATDEYLDIKVDNDTTDVKEASEVALATIGVRSHIFATNEEKQMNKLTNQLIQTQLEKLETKLSILNKFEKAFEFSEKSLERKKEEFLIQRLSFAKSSKSLLEKFDKSLEFIDNEDKKKEFSQHLGDIKSLLSQPLSLSFGPKFRSNIESNNDNNNSQNNIKTENDVKPISLDAPQFYRYWSA
ncbi:hypothetical protein KAFR_0F01720 [Kazachstania africana CBS 2517]|uniref:SWIRM domain-containing protein n=1 Tax=Kazachstania africana (strain ATCC 22294 / BCRC 22015 / CBS 2517 / CECT 1963 / NBRC 1671 / NRRL Y-8276) TaxID=1071382 RepID=H2AWL9_KAZAF|nr:hypothetical protein KAFR_0F01720 [Kazachstania africana CBS 2517]CCF58769.1 hypothetical protein KAFR_0F01720 [Kazachstania africana CBS 2517]